MADIQVRRIRFSFDEPIDLDLPEEALRTVLPALALSMTMPHLEPYLIRTMRAALPGIRDATLAEDARRFSQQEGHHYRSHALLNQQIRSSFDAAAAARLRAIEDALEADYRRFTAEKPLRWNLAYAEGFEAMTCAGALAMAEHGAFQDARLPGGELWGWHMAEEIEHRTVAFQVYEHLVGSYLHRVLAGARAQWHYLSFIRRFQRCMEDALGRRARGRASPAQRAALRRYLRTFHPRYDPARIEIPAGVDALLARYSALAASGAPASRSAPTSSAP